MVAKKGVAKRAGAKPVLLAGGNPQIAKADGDAPVQEYVAAMPGWKRDIGRRVDALIVRNVPDVRKAVDPAGGRPARLEPDLTSWSAVARAGGVRHPDDASTMLAWVEPAEI